MPPVPHAQRVETWAKRLGLAHSRLQSADKDPQNHHFALLDGVDGSLAVSTVEVDHSISLDWTWSAQLRSHVEVGSEKVLVRSVEPRAPSLRFELDQVDENLERFFSLVTDQNVKPAVTIVEHVTNCFRAHRALAAQQGLSAQDSLQTFLALIDDVIARRPEPTPTKLTPDHRHRVIEELRYNRLIGRHADLELTIRHAAGMVFQETHAELDAEPVPVQLFGLAPAPRRSTRNRLGAYYTPPGLARTLCDLAIRQHLEAPSLKILDPACGSGIFLVEVLHSLERHGYRGIVEIIGFDVSASAIEMARFALDHTRTSLQVRVTLEAADFLKLDQVHHADIVLMNPPFVAYEDLNDELKAVIRARLGPAFSFKPDFSMLFITLALAQVKQGGTLASLLPAGVLGQKSATEWRQQIVEGNALELIAILGDHGLFRDAIVNVSAVLLRKNNNRTELRPTMLWASPKKGSSSDALRRLRRWSEGDRRPERTPDWSIYQARQGAVTPKGIWTPRPNSLGELPEKLAAKPFVATVASLFHVEQGIRPGRIGDRLIIPVETWESLPAKEKAFFRPVVENRSIRGGQIEPINVMFFPPAPMTAQEVQSRLPRFYAQQLEGLELGKDELVEAIRPRRGTNDAHRPRLVSRIYVAEDSFAVDADGSFVVVQGSSWLPSTTLTDQPGDLVSLLTDYALLMNSRLFFMLLREFCRIVGGGQVEASKANTASVPLPNLPRLYRELPSLALLAEELRARNQVAYPATSELDRFTAAAFQTDVSEWTMSA